MKKFWQYNDAITIAGVLGLFLVGGFVAWRQWHSSSDEWETDFSRSLVSMNSITTTGMGRDEGIIPIDHPQFVDVSSAASWLDGRTPVIALVFNRDARAYPLTILLIHQIVNDEIDGKAVAVTYCPICNSPIVYEREIDGHVLRMGVTGNLYNNNFLMYDDLTQSWWHQFTGQAIIGEFAGRILEVVPSQVVAFDSFAEHYPRGEVLSGDEFLPNQSYVMNPYINYEDSSSPMMSHGDFDPRLPAMEHVIGVSVDGSAIAYPYSTLRQSGTVNDQLNGAAVVVIWQPGAASPLDDLTIRNSRDIGQAAIFGRLLNGRELHFYIERGRILDSETHSEWNIFGQAIAGELEGSQLESYTSYPLFWFAWASAHPETAVYHADE